MLHVGKLISEPSHGENVLWPGHIFFYLCSEPLNADIDSPRFRPPAVQHLIPCIDSPRFQGKEFQESELGGAQINPLVLDC